MDQSKIIGRQQEVETLTSAFQSKKAEMIALYGRRRVGKTYLVRSLLKNKATYLEVVGLKDGKMSDQLEIFIKSFGDLFYAGAPLQIPKNWKEAFSLLDSELNKLEGKITLFFDELPWLATPRSNLLAQLDHFWNSKWSMNPKVKIILCGSAASWMIDNIINAKGGLHNRLTDRLLIRPFTLEESEKYLQYKGIKLGRSQILELYMCIGGIPYYLHALKKGESVSQALNRLCFQKSGLLNEEFERLYSSLFNASDEYVKIVRALAKTRQGISRNKLLEILKMTSGGRFASRLKELEDTGFISSFVPFGKTAKDVSYRLIDEFSLFHLCWIEKAPRGIFSSGESDYWKKIQSSQSFRSWCGFTFEGICLKHYQNIMMALGLRGVGVTPSSWRMIAKGPKETGVQIDLLFDRDDGVVTLCELKYYKDSFLIEKNYAAELERKVQIFRKAVKTKKDIFLCLVTPLPAQQNVYYGRHIHNEVNLDSLF